MMQETWVDKLDIRTVVLVGKQDFGRCPLAERLPTALWPMAGKPVLQRLLQHLANEGVKGAVVCCEAGVSAAVDAVEIDGPFSRTVVIEDLSGGTGGCLRDAVASDPGELLMVFSGSMVCPPEIESLIAMHKASGAELTMVFNPGRSDGAAYGPPAEIYLCQPEVLRHIPRAGYSDIKEGLIPSILRAEGKVQPMVLSRDVGNFHDRKGYLDAVSVYLSNDSDVVKDCRLYEPTDTRLMPAEGDVFVHPTARIYGPVAVADHARLLERAVVVGPAVVGERTVVGEDSVVVNSVLWNGAEVGAGCEIRSAIIDCNATVPDRTVVAEQAVSGGVGAVVRMSAGGAAERMKKSTDRVGEQLDSRLDHLTEKRPAWASSPVKYAAYIMGLAVVGGVFLWSYWPTLIKLWEVWQRSDEYSAGLLVPLLSAYVLWSRRHDIARTSMRPAVLSGIALFLFAQGVRGLGFYFLYRSGEGLSIVLSAAALVLLVFGWRYLRKLTPILLFLCLMLPWPNRIQSAVTLPLQRWATNSAVFCLELVGYDIVQDGNIINIGDASVAVAEACNGLRMITAFFVISGLVVLLAKRVWWEKLLVLISSLPIALLCNTLRLAVTAVAFTMLEGEYWEKMFHDFGGFAMMPLALAMMIGEFWLLMRLTTPPTETKPAVIARRKPRHVPDS